MQKSRVVDLIPQPQRLLLAEVIGAFSYSLDMAEGQVPGHSLRCCWLARHIGNALSLSTVELWDLYYTVLLKDIGGSSIASKIAFLFDNDDQKIKSALKYLNTDIPLDNIKFLISHTSVQSGLLARLVKLLPLVLNGHYYLNELLRTRSERGADLVIQLGFNDHVADGVHCLNEHWDGTGFADAIKDHVIPINSQIALLSEVFDVYYQKLDYNQAILELKNRSSSWFNPELVTLTINFLEQQTNQNTWQSFKSESKLKEAVYALEPSETNVTIDDERLDDIATAFAQIVDAKSPYNFGHSTRVALYTDAIANELGLSVGRRRWLYRGALLHDIGNMGLSNLVLDEKSRLSKTQHEDTIQQTRFTLDLLQHLQSFKELAKVASSHHERLDGKGYPKGKTESGISLETRIITLANIFDSLITGSANSSALPLVNVLLVLEKKCDSIIDRDCFNALKKRIPSFFSD